jgi:2-oxoglutarate dehydrogenase E2 component (dihydrolipoamide succinyltransferase)
MATSVTIPEIGYGMVEAVIVEWLKGQGAAVEEGEPLLVLETEKASVEVEAPASGILRRITAAVGTTVRAGEVVAVVAGEDEDMEDLPSGPPEQAEERVSPEPSTPVAGAKMTPVAARMAKRYDIDVSSIEGTGLQGRITKDDVLRAVGEEEDRLSPEPVSAASREKSVPLTTTRRTIARRLLTSKKKTAEVTTVAEVNMDRVVQLKKENSISYTAFVVKASAEAIKSFPVLNSSLLEDELVLKNYINIGVAVATERGLVVPVVQSADKKGLLEISTEVGELSDRARTGGLAPEDLQGGTFTVTNSGAFGSLFFTPIINYPEVAILGMGKVHESPVVRQHQIAIGSLMYLCLTYDHRAMDGDVAVKFLQQVKRYLEDPKSLVEPQTRTRQ